MKQVLHIFAKDLRRLWPLVLLVATLFVLRGISPPEFSGASLMSLGERNNLLSVLVVLACWALGATVVHEDAPADESAFWTTRPYNRGSILTAKVLFLLAFIFLPLLFSGVLLEARAGIDIPANAGTLLLFDLAVAAWLILPALAIGAVTRNLTAFASVAGYLVIGYYVFQRWSVPTADLKSLTVLPDGPNIAALLPMILAALIVIGIQYAARKTQWNRAALAVAVIASGFLMHRPGVAMLSAHVVYPPPFDLNRIRISFDATKPPDFHSCPVFALKVEGLPAGTIIRPYGDPDAEVNSPRTGILPVTNISFADTADGYREYMCMPGMAAEHATLRATLKFTVVSVETVATLPARRGTFVAGNAGRCEIVTPFPESTQLRCDLAEPNIGSIGAGLEYPGYRVYARGFQRSNGPVRLSPVVLDKFDGVSVNTPGGWPFEEVFARADAHFVLRKERVIGTIERDLIYENIPFPARWPHFPVPRPPKEAGK